MRILIVGAGIIGLTLAKELIEQGVDHITILEKESKLGLHASGRNSGVLHAGIYYPAESLKAKFCISGNRMMKAYCRENGIDVHETGKVIVARTEAELPMLHELYQRATTNGAHVELINEQRLAEIEPNARTVKEALYSHETAVGRP